MRIHVCACTCVDGILHVGVFIRVCVFSSSCASVFVSDSKPRKPRGESTGEKARSTYLSLPAGARCPPEGFAIALLYETVRVPSL